MSDRVSTVFIRYYEEGFWADSTGSSGPNSAFEETPKLRHGLEALLKTYQIRSILDLGCGDANLFRYITLDSVAYLGIDCVPNLIKRNQQRFAEQAADMDFTCANILTTALPQADLILCRDVVHYLPNPLIANLLKNILRSNSTWLLITHNLYSALSANDITDLGIFRPVNLCYPPFHWPEPQTVIHEDVYGKALGLWPLQALASTILNFQH